MFKDKRKKVTVCAECLRASCWQGMFYCEDARDADIKDMTISELKKLGLESEHYWTNQVIE